MNCLLLILLILAGNSHAGAFLGDLDWQQAEQAIQSSTVIIPFAAGAKEHGPHLPLITDQLVMQHLLEAAVQHADVIVAPPILHGWFPAFRAYPGTEVSDPAVFQDYVRAVAESLLRHGAPRIVLLNLGIGKATGLPLAVVARDLRAEHGVPTLLVNWEDLEAGEGLPELEQERGGHADEGETSIILYLRPDLVHMDQAQVDYRGPPKEQIGYQPGYFDRSQGEIGVYGDPRAATAKKGEQILEVMVRNWLRALEQFKAN